MNKQSGKTAVLPVQREQRGEWRSMDMHVFPFPASASAQYRGLSPERCPSSAAVLALYDRDTRPLLGLACV